MQFWITFENQNGATNIRVKGKGLNPVGGSNPGHFVTIDRSLN